MEDKTHLRPSHADYIKVHPFFRQQSKAFFQADMDFTTLEENPKDINQTTIKSSPAANATDSSVCSLGASNAPNYTEKRKYEQDKAESAYDYPTESCEYEEEKSDHIKVKKTKRIRQSKVHSLCERRRREKINEKMRTLQDLIPNCDKADKVSVLDKAIDYLKTLQTQLQTQILIMSMGSRMYMTPQIPMLMVPQRMHLAMVNSKMGSHLNVQPAPNRSLFPSWPDHL